MQEAETSLNALVASIIKNTLEASNLEYKQGAFDKLIKIPPAYVDDVFYVTSLGLVIYAGLHETYADNLEATCSSHSLPFLFIDNSCINNIGDVSNAILDKVSHVMAMNNQAIAYAKTFIANPLFGKFDKNYTSYVLNTDDGVPVSLVSGDYLDDHTFQVKFIGADPSANLKEVINDLINDTPSGMNSISIAISTDIATSLNNVGPIVDDFLFFGFRQVAYVPGFVILRRSCK